MLLPIALLVAQATAAEPPMLPPLRLLPEATSGRCPTHTDATGDVIVCARNDARHRLPLPRERDTATGDGPIRGEAQRASIDGTAPCGIFQGQRRCGKAEAARYGYGGGRDPVTVGGKALRKLSDPDADLGDPTPYPRDRR